MIAAQQQMSPVHSPFLNENPAMVLIVFPRHRLATPFDLTSCESVKKFLKNKIMLHENSIVVYDYPVLRRGAYGPCPMYFMLETQRKQLLLLFLDNSWT